MTATNKSLKLIEILDAEFQMAEGLIYLTVLKKRQERSSLWRIGRGGGDMGGLTLNLASTVKCE